MRVGGGSVTMGAIKTSADFSPEALGLPSVNDYATEVDQALAAVTTDATARAAVGQTTTRIQEGYDKLVDLSNVSDADPKFLAGQRQELDAVNAGLQQAYGSLPDDAELLTATTQALDAWFTIQPLIIRAYLAVYLLELNQRQLNAFTPIDLSPVSLLKLAIAKATGDVVDIIKSVGDAATQATKGVIFSAWLPIALAGVGGLLYVFRKQIFGGT